MKKTTIRYSRASTSFYFDASIGELEKIAGRENAVLITDENLYQHHEKKFRGWKVIVLKPGEAFKTQATVDRVIDQLIQMGADRKTYLIGIGGGVITDITGYIAAVYMRGIPFGFIPTSILAMVDAAIGGKNGIDVGIYKNMVGSIRQPSFLLYDYALLRSLPQQEWINGFAEIIKHACIRDAAMFQLLESHRLSDFKKDKALLNTLIRRNALLKARVVQEDEFESGNRKLLNFGHTLGHAIENTLAIPHGQAVAVGMVAAAYLSVNYTAFRSPEKITTLLKKYGLPAFARFNATKALAVMQSDKKRVKELIHYVLLEKIGKAVVFPLTIKEIQPIVEQLSQ